jgi:mRNA interferase YafQ
VHKYKYTPKKSKRFKQGLRLSEKKGLDIDLLEWGIDRLARDVPLPDSWRDHRLKGSLKRFRECHIGGSGDWLLVYEKREFDMILYLLGTGSHGDLLDA